MRYISLFLLILAMISCDDSRKSPIQSAPKVENDRQSSAYWFPNMEAVPPIIPELPDDFIPGVVINKYLEKGNPRIVWSRFDVIEKLNQGATSAPTFFTVTESFIDLSRDPTPAGGWQSLISACTAMGFPKIEYESRKIDGWTINWFSGFTSLHWYMAWLTHPDGERLVTIKLYGDETRLPLWKNFIKSFERSEQGGRGMNFLTSCDSNEKLNEDAIRSWSSSPEVVSRSKPSVYWHQYSNNRYVAVAAGNFVETPYGINLESMDALAEGYYVFPRKIWVRTIDEAIQVMRQIEPGKINTQAESGPWSD